MGPLSNITGTLANSVLVGLRPAMQRLSVRLSLILITALLAVGGLFALCWAMIVALADLVPPAAAALIAALLLFSIAAIFWMIAWRVRVSPTAYAARAQAVAPDPLAAATVGASPLAALAADAGKSLGAQVRANPQNVALVALAAGVALGASPRLRRLLLG